MRLNQNLALGLTTLAIVVFAVFCSVIVIAELIHSHSDAAPYFIDDWQINYAAGFVRRGLLGEFARQLLVNFSIDTRTTIVVAQALAYLVFFGATAALLSSRTNGDPAASDRRLLALSLLWGALVLVHEAFFFFIPWSALMLVLTAHRSHSERALSAENADADKSSLFSRVLWAVCSSLMLPRGTRGGPVALSVYVRAGSAKRTCRLSGNSNRD